MPWSEIARSYKFEVTPEGIRGTKVYRTSSAGAITTANLPQINVTPFETKGGTTYTDCVAVRMVETHTDARAGNDAFQDRTYSFETPGGGEQANKTEAAEEKDISFFIGGEIETIDDPSAAWEWDGTSTDVELPMQRKVITGSFTRQVLNVSEDDVIDYIQGKIKPLAGYINTEEYADELMGFDIGQVLFNGASMRTRYDATEEAFVYDFDLEFIFKDIVGVAIDDWLYILDEADGTYKKPVTKAGANPLYFSTALLPLFQVP